jgi:flagellar hook-associated protein 1 FlgK
MRSTFHSLETVKRSLFTQQAAMQTTAHNIANANTPGYSRQIVNMQATSPLEAPGMSRSSVPGQLGTGVEFTSITRVREKFLDDQFHNENKSLGSVEVQQDTLDKLEKIVNEPSENGIRGVLTKFFNDWSDLSKNPENADGRKIVREQALALTDSFNHTAKQLQDLKTDLNNNVNIQIQQVNSILGNISGLNGQIKKIEALGDTANDLRDQRDSLTDQLSKIVNIQVDESSNGYKIQMGNTTLVDENGVTTVDNASMDSAFQSGDLNNGSVFGMMNSRDRFVNGYISELDKLANTLANGDMQVTIPKGSILPDGTTLNGVTYSGSTRELQQDLTVTVNGLNGLHQLGYNFTSTDAAPPFFTDGTGNTADLKASNITLNQILVDNPNQIATSLRTDNGSGTESVVRGNNTLAVLFSQARDASFNFGTSTTPDLNTIDTYFQSIVGELGVQAEDANRQLGNSKVLVDQVDARRQSVSGVSLDEEMANMIKFQHAYNAAARYMTMVDETLDRIINNMGLVGR